MLEARGWAVCDDSIAPAFRQQLYARSEAARQAGRFHPARIGRGEAATRDETVRGDSILWLERRHGDAVMDAFMDWAAQLRAELNQRYFLGLRREEFHFSHYPVGTGYRKHFDQHRGSPHRRISLVLYLNPEWMRTMAANWPSMRPMTTRAKARASCRRAAARYCSAAN